MQAAGHHLTCRVPLHAPRPMQLRGVGREAHEVLLSHINATGRAFLIHTELGGEYTLRLAVGGSHVQLRHVGEAWELARAVAARVLGKQLQ